MLKFRDVMKSQQDFIDKVITPCRDALGDVVWLIPDDKDKFYNNKSLFLFISNQFNERYIRWDEDEFVGYFINTYIQYTPMFFSKISAVIENKLKELQVNENVGKKTTINSKSKKHSADTTYEVDADQAPNTENISDYEMSSYTANMVENAKRLSQIKINGELQRYLGCFQKLFTQINLDREVESSFTPKLQDWLRTISDSVLNISDKTFVLEDGTKIVLTDEGKLEINVGGSQYIGDYADLERETKPLFDKFDLDMVKPIRDQANIIGTSVFVDETGTEEQFDDKGNRKVYTVDAVNDLIRKNTGVIKDLTALTTQDEIYNAVEVNGWYLIKENYLMQCSVKTVTQCKLFGFRGVSTTQQSFQSIISLGNTDKPLIISGSLIVKTPVLNNEVTTKKYVDDAISNVSPVWTVITDLWSNPLNFKKYENDLIRVSIDFDGSGAICKTQFTNLFESGTKNSLTAMIVTPIGNLSTSLDSDNADTILIASQGQPVTGTITSIEVLL